MVEQALCPGTQIESFEIQTVLGTGGFGVTYRAHDHSLDRVVAIKEYFPADLAHRTSDSTTLSPRTSANSEAYDYGLSRFLSEARTLARFNEPSIVRVNRYVEANGTAYLVMDYEDGKPLSDVIAGLKRLTERQAKAVLVHILRGLRAVHAQRYLHRDIKPANIFVRRSGPPVLLDFGAARLALERQAGDMTVVLTPGYAPIEQYGGEETQGPWSDLYAMGATVYHCMVGMPPLAATDRITAVHDGREDPVSAGLESVTDRYSRSFLEAVAWMLAPHASDRPRDIDSVLGMVTSARHGAPGHGTRGSAAAEDATAVRGAATARPGTGRATARGLDAAVLDAARDRLAEYLGPIAGVLVEQAAAGASDERALYAALAEELDDEAERRAFLSGR